MADTTVAVRTAQWVTELRFEDLFADFVERTKLLILDQLGVRLLGASPAALALAERDGVSGRDVITAVVAGTQVMALLGAATAEMVVTGWHGSKVRGVFGARRPPVLCSACGVTSHRWNWYVSSRS
jgi:2-methylcitrate dehydratase PrpD